MELDLSEYTHFSDADDEREQLEGICEALNQYCGALFHQNDHAKAQDIANEQLNDVYLAATVNQNLTVTKAKHAAASLAAGAGGGNSALKNGNLETYLQKNLENFDDAQTSFEKLFTGGAGAGGADQGSFTFKRLHLLGNLRELAVDRWKAAKRATAEAAHQQYMEAALGGQGTVPGAGLDSPEFQEQTRKLDNEF